MRRTVNLPFPARKLVSLEWALIESNFDDDGIAIVNPDDPREVRLLKVHSAPTSFEVRRREDGTFAVVWVEAQVAGVGGPWIFWTPLDFSPSPITEVSYPISGGTGGQFVGWTWAGFGTLVDVGGDGHTYIARFGEYIADSPSPPDVVDMGPTPPGTLTFAERIDDALTEGRIAAFFDVGTSTQVVVFDYHDLPTPLGGPVVRTWPKRVLHAEQGRYWSTNGPFQFALLAPDGTVDIWQFEDDPNEDTYSLFGQFPAGTQRLGSLGVTGVGALAPDGRVIVLANNGENRALAPQSWTLGGPCQTCTLAESNFLIDYWYAIDSLAVRVNFPDL